MPTEDRLPTISEKDMREMMRQDPFITFAQVPIAEVRMNCLKVIGDTGRCFPKLAEQAPGWLEFFLEQEDIQLASKLLNVWLYHYCHTKESLASAVNSALAVAADPKLARDIVREVFSREVCSQVSREISAYWNTPRLHPFLEACLIPVLSRSFYDKEKSVVRRALNVICEAGDTSMLPRLAALHASYCELHKKELDASARNTFALSQKIGAKVFEMVIVECIDYLVGLRKQEIEQWRVFKNLLNASARNIGIPHPKLRPKYPSPQQANSANPATVGLAICEAEEVKDKNRLINLLGGLTVTLIGDGIKDSQVYALTPAGTTEVGGIVGRFDQNLECLFRLEGLEGMEGKKRYRLLVHATKPVLEIRPTLLCTLTGYVNFA